MPAHPSDSTISAPTAVRPRPLFVGARIGGRRHRRGITSIVGAVRVNTGLRRGLDGVHTGITLGDVARRNFTIVRENDVAFEVIQRIWRKRAVMAVVVRGGGVPRPQNIAGVITKEHVADSVASSVQIYPS